MSVQHHPPVHPRVWEELVRVLAWTLMGAGVIVAGVIAPIYDDSWLGPMIGTWLCALGLVLSFAGRRGP
jgi:hypothetical protein